MFSGKKAQSTLEYIIIFTVVVAAVLIAANTMIRGRMQNILNHVSNQAQTAVEHVNFSD